MTSQMFPSYEQVAGYLLSHCRKLVSETERYQGPGEEWPSQIRTWKTSGNSATAIVSMEKADAPVILIHCVATLDEEGEGLVFEVGEVPLDIAPQTEEILDILVSSYRTASLYCEHCDCGHKILGEDGDYRCPACRALSNRPEAPA